jgi:peptidoglycan/xylan/chitin deacetylase (PgdA/CDA1 family)
MSAETPLLSFRIRSARYRKFAEALFVLAGFSFAMAGEAILEIHQRLVTRPGDNAVALTLDACGGGYDADLIAILVEFKVPATIFLTRKWAERHPEGIAALRAHPALFQLEDHGADHVPAVMGSDTRVFGIRAAGSPAALDREVEGGAAAIERAGAPRPVWFRGATARYDAESLKEIARLGYRVAGFSVNADQGATLPRRAVARRLLAAQPGDIVIAHMNKPASDTAEALRDALPALLAKGIRFVKLESRSVQPAGRPTLG